MQISAMPLQPIRSAPSLQPKASSCVKGAQHAIVTSPRPAHFGGKRWDQVQDGLSIAMIAAMTVSTVLSLFQPMPPETRNPLEAIDQHPSQTNGHIK